VNNTSLIDLADVNCRLRKHYIGVTKIRRDGTTGQWTTDQ